MSGDSGHGSSQTDAYDELFHTHNTLDLNPLDNEQEEPGNKVNCFFELVPWTKQSFGLFWFSNSLLRSANVLQKLCTWLNTVY